MTSKDIELVKEMLRMQESLDKKIMKAHGLKSISKQQLNMAILDEVGELTHELKGSWCWWKKTQAPVDDKKVLGELVDVWHFVLSYQNHFNFGKETLYSYLNEKKYSDGYLERFREGYLNLPIALTLLVSDGNYIIEMLIAITEYIGFTIEQVYEAYCGKNKINYQRLESGY